MTEEEQLEAVWQEKFLKDDNHLKELRGSFLKKLEGSENEADGGIRKDIENCTDELQRVQLIKRYFKWIPVPAVYIQRFQKSADMSQKLREKANGAYKAGDFTLALRGYDLAILFSRIGEEELGLAYGNRSALFVQIKEAKLALRDIQLALENKYPENLQDKLVERRKKCNEVIQRRQNNNDKSTEMKTEGTKYSDENILKLKTQHPTISNAEQCITIDYASDRGRRLVVNRNTPAGAVLAVEEPFIQILTDYLTWYVKRCHFCNIRLRGGIPCTNCTFAMYCGEDCREKAVKSYHRFENNAYLVYHHCHQTVLKDLIAARIVGKVGPSRLFVLFQQSRQLLSSETGTNNNHEYFSPKENSILGYDDKGMYNSQSYLPIYHLISHAKGTALSEIVSNVFRAIVLTYALRDTSDFFSSLQSQYTEEHSQELFEEFISSLLLRHIENIPYNAIAISELQTGTKEIVQPPIANSRTLKNCKSHSYATAIFPFFSLANHSCNSNTVMAKRCEFLKTAFVTLRSLEAGDEIFISYKPQFTTQSLKERRNFLLDRYHFVCQCDACVNDWTIDTISNYQLPKKYCNDCSSGSKVPRCVKCDQYCVRFALELEDHQSKLYEADELLKNGDFIQATGILVKTLQFYSSNSSSLFSLFQVAQDLYKRALVLIMNSYD